MAAPPEVRAPTLCMSCRHALRRDAGLRKTFNSIDTDGKGHITQHDLEAFAARSGLPASYATNFASAVRATHRQQSGGESEAGVEEEGDAELTFAMFRHFVRSREEALRRAFNLFDQDGDGRISVDDLDASLSRVAVCCPRTRCIYRCRGSGGRGAMAIMLHAKMAPENGSLGFSEFRDFFLLLPQQDMLVEYWVAAGTPELSDKVSVMGRDAAKGGSPWGHLLAGAIAGATSRTATAPLETLRLAAMAGQLQSRSLAQAASDIVSSQGWQGLYRGNLLNVMRSAPQKALDFFAFDGFKRLLGDDSHLKTFLAAGMAGCTSWVALYPLEVVRSRVTVAAATAATAALRTPGSAAGAAAAAISPNLIEALSTIIRREGTGALYKGLGPSVAAIFPEAALTYGLHDALKKAYKRAAHEEPGVAPSLAFGVLSAFVGQLVSFPLETVSRRLQLQVAADVGVKGGGSGLAAVMAVARGLVAEGGPAALYRGIGAATLRLVPMAIVSFGTYEAVRALIVAWEAQRDDEAARRAKRTDLASRCMPLVLEGPNGGAEVVGRVCAPAGSTAPTLCSSAAPCGAGPGPGQAAAALGQLVALEGSMGTAAGAPCGCPPGSGSGSGAGAGVGSGSGSIPVVVASPCGGGGGVAGDGNTLVLTPQALGPGGEPVPAAVLAAAAAAEAGAAACGGGGGGCGQGVPASCAPCKSAVEAGLPMPCAGDGLVLACSTQPPPAVVAAAAAAAAAAHQQQEA
ncbi:hypothetical protein HYH03_001049 [Edaphochlamys debaryana]|uniref:EF-hand domain-containing protein n=1 Tax=Edaphochlamys debaryana TaxID=47281 RepID=A0A835YE71_9CHLO|nr:hypothetical protein HYH03_001049 [Edaphochlamys debaryana]|eukprot:KAG2501242.1 hypothetical protein HYH03_001049 [Edaphochlamys debaryana]